MFGLEGDGRAGVRFSTQPSSSHMGLILLTLVSLFAPLSPKLQITLLIVSPRRPERLDGAEGHQCR